MSNLKPGIFLSLWDRIVPAVRRRLRRPGLDPGRSAGGSEVVEFLCNVCGGPSSAPPEAIHREIPSCRTCGSTVRFRALVHVLSRELFGESLPLDELPLSKDVRGVGLSDWTELATRLERRFDYVNTFYHRRPRLDICDVDESISGTFDFVVSSDVFEHVAPPVSRAFENAYRLLKPGGFLLLTVPYRAGADTIEHFPELYEYRLIKRDGDYRLWNRTREGTEQWFDDLTFHGGPGATLEMRVMGQSAVEEHLREAGFESITIYGDDCEKYGVRWPNRDSLPIAARRPDVS